MKWTVLALTLCSLGCAMCDARARFKSQPVDGRVLIVACPPHDASDKIQGTQVHLTREFEGAWVEYVCTVDGWTKLAGEGAHRWR